MDFVPSSLTSGASTLVGATLSGATVVGSSTISGATIVGSTITGATIVNSTINSGNTISPYAITRHQTVCVHRSLSGQTISNTTATLVHHNSEDNDPDGVYDNTTYRMTPTVSGTFLVIASVGYLGQSSGNLITSRIYKNGSNASEARVESAGSNVTAIVAARVIVNGSTDYIEHYTFQESGGDLDMDSDATQTYMHAIWIDR